MRWSCPWAPPRQWRRSTEGPLTTVGLVWGEGEGGVVGDVLDGGGGDDSLGQQLGGGGNTDGGDGVGVHLGHRVGHGGDRRHALHLHRLGSLHSNWGSSVDVVVGNRGNSGVHGSNWVGDNMGHSV